MATQKRIISLLLAVALLLTLAGCELTVIGNPEGSGSLDAGNPPRSPSDPSDPSAPTDPSDPEVPTDPSVPTEPEDPGNDDPSGGNEQEKEEEEKPTVSAPTTLDGLEIAKEAVKYMGVKYVYGGNSLTNGVDCSGFTTQIYKKFGISLPRTAAAQSKVGYVVSEEEAKPGDLYAVSYSSSSKYTGHAGIYLGNGFIIAAEPGVGVCLTHNGVSSGPHTYIRLFENTATFDKDELIPMLEKIAIANGYYNDGTLFAKRYHVDTQKFIIEGRSPLHGKSSEFYELELELDVLNPPEGYEPLAKAWKKWATEEQGYWLSLYGKTWAYYEGRWMTYEEYLPLYYDDTWYQGLLFYGNAWENGATITNGFGEVVDLSTIPEPEN